MKTELENREANIYIFHAPYSFFSIEVLVYFQTSIL